MPSLPPIGPSWFAPNLPWLLVLFAVLCIVLGATRGPLHDTKVYGRFRCVVYGTGILFALSAPLLIFAAISDKTRCGYRGNAA